MAITLIETTIAPPDNFIDYSPVYRIDPLDETFSIAIPLVVPYGNNDGEVGRLLAIYASRDATSPFERLSDSYVNAGFLQGSIKRFGYFFAGYPKVGADLACP